MPVNTTNLDLALRIHADTKAAATQLDLFEKELLDIDKAATKAGTSLNKATASPAISKGVSKNNKELEKQAERMKYGGITAGQYSNALRQLPAQITDVATSLASGSPVWLVAIQQGGQIRDSFGGFGNSLKALLSFINPTTIALGAMAAAGGAVALAYKQGADESREFTEALILSGNAAGTSADELAEISKRLDDIAGTRGQASAVLAELARTGQFSVEQMEQVAASALLMSDATGESTDAMVADFKKIAEDPVEAIAKLNEQYHFLDAATYSNIVALQEQGKETEAATLAMNTFADTMSQRAGDISADVGLLGKAWSGTKNFASEAWDEMLGIGRASTLEETLQSVTQQLEAAEREATRYNIDDTPLLNFLRAERERIQLLMQERDERSKTEGERRQHEDAAIDAQRAIDRLTQSNLSNEEKRTKALQEYSEQLQKLRAANANDPRLDPEAIAKNIKGINSRFIKETKEETDKAAEAMERFVKQLERAAELQGKSAAEVREYEIAEEGLTDALLKRAQAANAVITAQEQLNQANADAEQLASIQTQLLRLQGNNAEARGRELEAQFQKLMDRLVARGDVAGQALVQELIDTSALKAGLDDLQSEIAKIEADIGSRRGLLSAQFEAGRISQPKYREELALIDEEAVTRMERLRDAAQEYSDKMEDPSIIANFDAMVLGYQRLIDVSERFLADGLEINEMLASGLTDSLLSVADHTTTAGEAFRNFALNFLRYIAEMIFQQTIFNAINGGGDGSGGVGGVIAGALRGLSEGGYTGPGGKYDPAGIVHAGEYVQPAHALREPGALAFMESFRREGMRSLQRFQGYADGGLVDGSAAASMAPAGGVNVNNRARIYLLQDRNELAEHLARHPAFEKAVVGIAGKNGNAIQAEW